MYQEFKLTSVKDVSIMGYYWEAEEPCCIVLIIHGIGEYAGRFDRMANFLKEAHISALAMDLRGHGCSSGTRGHVAPRQAVLSDLDHLIEYAQQKHPKLPIFIYGHSLGGNIVLDHRQRGILAHVPRGYVVSSPWLLLTRKVSKFLYHYVKTMAKVKPEYQMSSEVNPLLLGNPQILMQEKHIGLIHGQITALAAIEGYEIGKRFAQGAMPAKNAPPFLLMHGDADELCSVEGSRSLAEIEKDHCTYIEWPNYYHELHNGNAVEDGETVIRLMIDWMKGLLL